MPPLLPGKALFTILVGTLGASAPALAQDLGARAMGRGGAARADGSDAAAEAQNLAAVSLAPRYEMVAGAELGPDGRFLLRGAAVDSRTSAVSLGAGYRRLADNVPPTGAALPGWKAADEDLEDPTSHQGFHLGLAIPLLERRFSFGASGRYDWRDSELSGKTSAFNLSFFAAGKPLPALTVAAGLRNALTNDFADTTRSADLSARYDFGPYLGLEGDVVAPLDTFDIDEFEWHAGGDAAVTKWMVLRGGWYADASTHFVTGGIGLVSDKASLDYGVRVRVDDPARNWHALDLRVVF